LSLRKAYFAAKIYPGIIECPNQQLPPSNVKYDFFATPKLTGKARKRLGFAIVFFG
jgi:hypothetical protein